MELAQLPIIRQELQADLSVAPILAAWCAQKTPDLLE